MTNEGMWKELELSEKLKELKKELKKIKQDKKRGEEPIAQEVGDGYTRIFKQNPNLWDILQNCLFGRY